MSENEKQGTFLFHNRIPSGTPAARNVIKCHLSVRFGIVSQTSLLKSQQVNASGWSAGGTLCYVVDSYISVHDMIVLKHDISI